MSQTIDQKVVEMQFNNAQFESNVKTSLSTLDELKKSLNFDGMTKGLDGLDKASKNIDFSQMSDGISAVEKRFSTMGIVGMTVIQNLTNSVVNFAKRGIKGAIDTVIGGGKRRAFNIENARFQLQGLLDTEKEVNDIMDDAMWSVDQTAYAYDEAAKAASMFAASGMRSGDEMRSALRAITGVAAMTNSEYEGVSRIFTQVAGQGRLMGNDLLQLASRGLNASAALAKYFNGVNDGSIEAKESIAAAVKKVSKGTTVTEADIRDFVSKGKLSFDIFSAAMDDAFGEHAKKANDTVTGAFSNIRAALARIGADFISPLIEQKGPLVNFLNAVREKIKALQKILKPVAEVFTSTVNSILEAATKLINGIKLDKLGKTFSGIGEAISKGIDALTGAKKKIVDVNDLLKMFAPKEKPSLEDFYNQDASDKLSAKISGDVDKNTKTFLAFQKVLQETAKEHGIAIDEMIEKEGSFTATLKNGWLTSDIFNDAIEKITSGKLTSGAKKTAEDLELIRKTALEVIRGNYSDDWATRIEKLSAAGFSESQIQDVRDYVNILWDLAGHTWNLTDAMYEEADARLQNKETIEGTSDEQLKSMGYTEEEIKLLREWAKTAGESGGEVNKEVDSLLDRLNKPSGIAGFFKTFIDGFEKVKGYASSAKDAFLGAFSTDTFVDIKNTLVGLWDIVKGIGSTLLKVFGPVVVFLAGALGDVTSAFFKITGSIGKFASKELGIIKSSKTVNKIYDAMSKNLSKLGTGFGKVTKVAGSFAGRIIDRLSDKLPAVHEWFSKLIDKIKGSDVFNAASSWLSNVGEKFGSFLDGLDGIGLADGLFDKIGSWKDSLTDFYNTTIKTNFNEFVKTVNEKDFLTAARELVTKIKGAIVEAFFGVNVYAASSDELVKTVGLDSKSLSWEKVRNKIAETIINLRKALTGDFSGLSAIKEDFQKALNFVKDLFSKKNGGEEKTPWIVTFLENIKSKIESLNLDKANAWYDKHIKPFIDKIDQVIKDLSTDDTIRAGKEGIKILAVIGFLDHLRRINNLIKSLSKVPGEISLFLKDFRKELVKVGNAYSKDLKAKALLKTFGAISILLGAIAGCIFLLGSMPPDQLQRGMDAIIPLIAIVSGIALIFTLISKKGSSAGAANGFIATLDALGAKFFDSLKAFSKMAGAGILIAGVGFAITSIINAITMLKDIDWEESQAALLGLLGIASGLLIFCAAISKMNSKGQLGVGAALSILAIAFAVGKLVDAIKEIAESVSEYGDNLIYGIVGVGVLLIALSGAIKRMGQAKINLGASIAIFAIAEAMKILVSSVSKLASMDLAGMAKGIVAVSVLMWSLSRAVARIGKNKVGIKSIAALVAMVVAVKLLATTVEDFADMDTKSLVQGVAGIAAIMLALSFSLKIMNSTKFEVANIAALGIMLFGLYELIPYILSLASLPYENALAATLGLSALLVAMAGAMLILSKVNPAGALKGGLAIIVIVAVIIAIMEALGALAANVEGFSENIEAAAELIGGSIGKLVGAFQGAREAEYIKKYAETVNGIEFNDDNIAKAEALLTFMQTLAGDGSIQSTSTGLFGLVVNNNTTLEQLGKGMVQLADGASTFANSISNATFNDEKIKAAQNLIRFLKTVAADIGIQSFDKGLLGCMQNHNRTLEFLGTGAAVLGLGIGVFASVISLIPINDDKITKAEEIIKFLQAVAADIGIQSFDKGLLGCMQNHNRTLEFLGTGASALGIGIGVFATTISLMPINDDKITKAEEIIKFLQTIAADIGIQSFDKGLLGCMRYHNRTLEFLGEGAAVLGAGISAFTTSISLSVINEDAINKAKGVINFLKTVAADTGIKSYDTGILGLFKNHDVTLQVFGENAASFGPKITEFANSIRDIQVNPLDLLKVKMVTDFLIAITNDEGIPKSYDKGLLGFFGSKDTTLSNFGQGAKDFGDGISQFISAIKDNGLSQDDIDMATKASNMLSDLQKAVSGDDMSTGGFFREEGELEEFGRSIGQFGGYIQVYYTYASGWEQDKATSALVCLTLFKKGIEDFLTTNFDKLEDLKGKLDDIGALTTSTLLENLATNADAITGAAQVLSDALATGLNDTSGDGTDLKESGGALVGKVIEGIKNKANDMHKAGQSSTRNYINGLKQLSKLRTAGSTVASTPLTQIMAKGILYLGAGIALASKFLSGLTSLNGTIGSCLNSTLGTCVSNARGYYQSFYNAGSYLSSGLNSGLKSMLSSIIDTVNRICSEVNKAVKAKQQISSPSKVWTRFGEYMGRGLAIGLSNSVPIIRDSAVAVADETNRSLSSVLSGVSDVLMNGMDAEPTIRPVVDLSDVEAGSMAISQLLNMSGSIGLNSNIGSLAYAMAGYSNGATNDDVISAINGLRKNLGVRGDTYNINGITYDDGSNITDAVRTLVRAARVERRG